jgi:hypothetical protein
MKVYKITVEKTVFVEAENKDEAKEVYYEEGEMMSDERITNVSVSSKKEMRQMMLEGE